MRIPPQPDPSLRRTALAAAGYGATGGLLIATLRWTEYRFLVVEHSIEIYGGLVAATFAGLGIWLGTKLSGKAPETAAAAAPATPAPAAGERRGQELGLTPRELEILALIAAGLSNREIADRLCVSENTVKTHSRRLFDKLGARRRTQAVHLAKAAGLIP